MVVQGCCVKKEIPRNAALFIGALILSEVENCLHRLHMMCQREYKYIYSAYKKAVLVLRLMFRVRNFKSLCH